MDGNFVNLASLVDLMDDSPIVPQHCSTLMVLSVTRAHYYRYLRDSIHQMTTCEFLHHIQHVLTQNERLMLMKDKALRLRTFMINWPYHDGDHRSGENLASSGFYSLYQVRCASTHCTVCTHTLHSVHPPTVQCVFCASSISRLDRWEIGATIESERTCSHNHCEFLRETECGGRITLYNSQSLPARIDSGLLNMNSPYQQLGISRHPPPAQLAKYTNSDERLRTYRRWPYPSVVSAQLLCDAGFFYTNCGDETRCFYCSVELREWKFGDDPWVEHSRWSPECLFLLQKKGGDYIRRVYDETPEHKRKSMSNKQTNSVALNILANRTRGRQPTGQTEKQSSMRDLCLQLGHSPEVIDRAIAANRRPFTELRAMIDAIYTLEESEEFSVRSNGVTIETRRLRQVSRAQQNIPHTELNCWNCEGLGLNMEDICKASYIGLACGHLLFCDRCNDVLADTPCFCPVPRCQQKLTATLKCYTA